MNILALDLGTKCGWAVSSEFGSPIGRSSGVWDLKPSRFDSAGQRFVSFRNNLRTALLTFKIDLIVYEEVRNHMAVDAAHVYGGLVSILQTEAIERKIEFKGIGVGTIKKHATGNGAAKKDAMISAAIKLYPSVNVIDDNHADALCLLNLVTQDEIF